LSHAELLLYDFLFKKTAYSIISAIVYIVANKMKILKIISFSVLIMAVVQACSPQPTVVTTSTLIPTATLSPLPAPLPSPTPSIVLFADGEFTNSCTLDSTTDVERFVENGQFNMRVLTPLFVAWTKCTQVEYVDFIMEVDAAQVSGPDNNTYGVIFRYGLDAKEFYAFLISGDGFYVFTVDGADREEPEILVDWTESSAINKGAQTNHIKVAAIGGNMKYFVNGQFLGEVQDTRFSTGVVGFFAGSLDEGGVQVSFDNLIISQP
jgi:hypothetical protein